MKLANADQKLIALMSRWFEPAARLALFVVFFWFGALKLLNLSPAGPLALALVNKTIGAQYFSLSYHLLAVLECIIGILFLFPKATRVVIPLLLFHMIMVSAPLLLVPNLTWSRPLVPTLEGQYIIKNMAVIALAIGIVAHTRPLQNFKRSLR